MKSTDPIAQSTSTQHGSSSNTQVTPTFRHGPGCSYEIANIEQATALVLDNIGFSSVRQSCFYTLSSIMKNYFELLCRTTKRHAESAGRENIIFSDVEATFNEKNICLNELHDYLREVGSFCSETAVPLFPVQEARVSTNITPESVLPEKELEKKQEDNEINLILERRNKLQPQRTFPNFFNCTAFDLGFTPSTIPNIIKTKKVDKKNLLSSIAPSTSTQLNTIALIHTEIKEEVNYYQSSSNISPEFQCHSSEVIDSTVIVKKEKNVEKIKPQSEESTKILLQSSKKKRKNKEKKHKKKDKKEKQRRSDSPFTKSDFSESLLHYNENTNMIGDEMPYCKLEHSTIQSDYLEDNKMIKQETIVEQSIETLTYTSYENTNDFSEDLTLESEALPQLKSIYEYENTHNNTMDESLPILIGKVPVLKISCQDKLNKKEKKKKSKHEKKEKELRKLEKLERKHIKHKKKALEEQKSEEFYQKQLNDSKFDILSVNQRLIQEQSVSDPEPTSSGFSEQKSLKLKIKLSNDDLETPLENVNEPKLDGSLNDTEIQVLSFLENESLDYNEKSYKIVKSLKIVMGNFKDDESSNEDEEPNLSCVKQKKEKNKKEFTKSKSPLPIKKNSPLESKESLISGKKCLTKNKFSPHTSTSANAEENQNEPSSLNKISEIDSTPKRLKNKNIIKKIKNNTFEKQDTPFDKITEEKRKFEKKKKDKKKTLESVNDNEKELLISKTLAESLFDNCFSKEKESEEKLVSSTKSVTNDFDNFNKEKTSDGTPFNGNKKIEKKKQTKALEMEVASVSTSEIFDSTINKLEKKPNFDKEKAKPKDVILKGVSSSLPVKKFKKNFKERPATTTPPPSKRKKMEQSFVANSISAMKKSKSKNFPSTIKESRLSSSLSYEERISNNSDGLNSAPASPPLIVEDGDENIWICPVCSIAYVDGAADMVGCDACDSWYHWHCVGLLIAPPENKKWFCTSCTKKRKKNISSEISPTTPLTSVLSSSKSTKGVKRK